MALISDAPQFDLAAAGKGPSRACADLAMHRSPPRFGPTTTTSI